MKAKVVSLEELKQMCEQLISEGGRTHARMCSGKDYGGATFIAGVDYFGQRRDDYYYILDNYSLFLKCFSPSLPAL